MSRELPIIFSAAMVRAILAGRKTQTRRVPPQDKPDEWMLSWGRYRYGEPGDALYVREAWRTAASLDDMSPAEIAKRAFAAGYQRPWAPLRCEADGRTDNADTLDDFGGAWGRLRPSIHMPRWASRIRLTRKSPLRLERLSDITCDDIRAEGIESPEHRAYCTANCPDLRRAWETGWDSINGKRPGASTADDPLVVVVDWGDVEVTR